MEENKCPHCSGDISIRNPTGKCDHLYYPDYCETCRALTAQKAELKAKFKKVMDDTPFIGADAFCYKINVQKQIEAL